MTRHLVVMRLRCILSFKRAFSLCRRTHSINPPWYVWHVSDSCFARLHKLSHSALRVPSLEVRSVALLPTGFASAFPYLLLCVCALGDQPAPPFVCCYCFLMFLSLCETISTNFWLSFRSFQGCGGYPESPLRIRSRACHLGRAVSCRRSAPCTMQVYI